MASCVNSFDCSFPSLTASDDSTEMCFPMSWMPRFRDSNSSLILAVSIIELLQKVNLLTRLGGASKIGAMSLWGGLRGDSSRQTEAK
jgi:hypothetical protein